MKLAPVLLAGCLLAGCAVTGVGVGVDAGPVGYYDSGYYAPYGYEYGGWGAGYRVAPWRGGDRDHHDERRNDHPQRHAPAFRPAPRERPMPSLPRSRDHDRPH